MERSTLRSADGTEIAAYRWNPEGESKGDVLLVHGLADHMGRYGHVAKALTDAGYRVTGLDLRGHGHSAGKRGHVDSWEQYVDDVRAAADLIDGPHAILCHSMGGLVTLDYLRDGQAWAAFTSAPLLGVAVKVPRWKAAAAGALSRWLPRLSMGNEIDSQWVCSDPAVVEAYDADPLVFGTVTPRWYVEAQEAMARVRAAGPGYDIPLFAAYGTEDRLVSTAAIRDFYEVWGADDKKIQEFEGLYHEILNEEQGAEILVQVVAWFDAHCPEGE